MITLPTNARRSAILFLAKFLWGYSVMVQQIRAGQKDGSITNPNQPEEIFLTIWALLIGFTKLTFTTKESKGTTLFQVNLLAWKQRIFNLIEAVLRG